VAGRPMADMTTLAALPAGPFDLELAFDNDASGDGEDRNLMLASVTIGRTPWEPKGFDLLTLPTALVSTTVGGARIVLDGIRWDRTPTAGERTGRFASALLANLGMPFTGPAADLDPIPPAAFRRIGSFPYFTASDGGLRFGSNGAAEAAFRCAAPGRYRIVLRGSGTPVKGEYPKVRLSLDGSPAGELEIKSDAPREFTVPAADLTPGDHRLRIEFINDAYDPPDDRNLLLHAVGFRRD